MNEQAIFCYYNTLKEAGCYDFLRPMVRRDVQDILNAVPETTTETAAGKATSSNGSTLISSPTASGKSTPSDASTLISPAAASDMENLLLERLHPLYTGILITRLNRQVKEYDYMQAIRPLLQPTEELRRAARDIKAELESKSRNEGDCLTLEYPFLKPYLDRIRDNYRNHMHEVLSRFHARRQELADCFFGGQMPLQIVQMSSSGADMHRKGRCVVRISTDAGDCFYKPHDCGLDEFYRDITRKWFSDCTLAPDVIRGDDYAFVSPLVRRGLEEEEDAARYYYHFGILTALLHGLGSNDIHGENVIPSGDLPCIVDLESIVSTEKKQSYLTQAASETAASTNSKEQTETETPGNAQGYNRTAASTNSKELTETVPDPFQGIGTSVLRMGILPVRLHKGGIVSPLYQSGFEESPLPFYGDRTFSIEGREPEFIRGFREGYQRMLLHREEILQMLASRPDVLVRIIPFNTVYYARCRGRLFSEDALRSEQAKEKVLSDLAIPFTWYGREANQPQIAFEASALKEGDIPYFCTTLSSHDLYATSLDELVQKDYLNLSAMEYTAKSLARLSPQDLAMEEDMLKRSFIHAPLDVPVSQNEREWPIIVEIPEQQELPLITNILHEITADRFYLTDGRAYWISHASTTRNQIGTLAQLAGVILFSDRIRSCPECSAYFEEAGRLLRESLKDMEIALKWLSRFNARSFRNQLSAGFGAGMGQVLYSLGVTKAGKLREQILDQLMKNEIWQIVQPNLLEGLAGLLLGILAGEPPITNCQSRLSEEPQLSKNNSALVKISRSTDDPSPEPQPDIGSAPAHSCTDCLPQPGLGSELSHSCTDRLQQPGLGRELILRCTDRLLQLPAQEEPDAFTGSAGIGCALAKAYACTGKEAYAAGAVNAFAKVREAYSESQKGWVKSGGVMTWAAKRAPKAAGIGLCALEALKVLEMGPTQNLKAERKDRKESGQTTRIVPATSNPAADLPSLTQTIQEVLSLAVDSLLTEDHLYWNDSLYRGNALSVLFLARAGAYLHRPDLQERAGRIFAAMELRRKASGYYHLMDPGVRSTFDISFLEGTLGIGYAAMELQSIR